LWQATKTESSYREAFSHLKQAFIDMSLNFNPEVKIASFKKALKNAIQKEFPINTRLEVDGFIYHTSYTKKKCKCIRPTTCIQASMI
jgi:hypothetical protein